MKQRRVRGTVASFDEKQLNKCTGATTSSGSRESSAYVAGFFTWRDRLDETTSSCTNSRIDLAQTNRKTQAMSQIRLWKWIFSDMPCKE